MAVIELWLVEGISEAKEATLTCASSPPADARWCCRWRRESRQGVCVSVDMVNLRLHCFDCLL